VSPIQARKGILTHKKFICHCNGAYCNFCAGGLFSCTVCHGAEGSLATECPGRPMTQQHDSVYQGKRDFVGGKWINVRTGSNAKV